MRFSIKKSESTSWTSRRTTIVGDRPMARSDFRKAERNVEVSVGESVRIIRELQGLSQNQLAERSRISQSTISAIENDRVNLGVERAKVLARALRCHPAVLVFPSWDVGRESAA
jgi:ribosome-binding protein aMBF1 (putative translation factor)